MPIEIKYNNLAVHIDSFWVPVLCFFELNLHYVKKKTPHPSQEKQQVALGQRRGEKKGVF